MARSRRSLAPVAESAPKAYLDSTVDDIEQAFHFNVSTAHALVSAAVPIMLEHGGGSVVIFPA
jgi:7-alpha-hydroxysteroid dehydrogenase